MAIIERPPTPERIWVNLLDPSPDPWLENPVGFIRKRIGDEPWSKQREIAESVRDNLKTAVPSCFASGKSHIAADIAAWWIQSHPPGMAKVITTSSGWDQVRSILWQGIGRAHAKGQLIGTVNQTEWWVPVDGRDLIVGLGRRPPDWNPIPLQGHHADAVLVIIDEAAGVPEGFFEALNGLTIGPNDRTLAIGNPWRPSDTFGQICKPGSGWNTIRISAFDTPNFTGEAHNGQLITPAWVEDVANRFGRDSAYYISKVLAQFPDMTEDGLFHMSWIEAAQRRTMPRTRPFEAGVDVADEGQDSSVIYLRQGGRVRLWGSWRAPGVMTSVGHILRCWQANDSIDSIKIDAQPPGVLARLKELQHLVPAMALQFGGAPVDKERFRNAKAEWYWHLRDLFEDGRIDIDPDDDELVRQLLAIRIDWGGSAGKVGIESKQKARSRGEPSPDRVDALAYAFAPVSVGRFSGLARTRGNLDPLEDERRTKF